MSDRKRKDIGRTLLDRLWRESGDRIVTAARIVLETTIIYLLFLLGIFIISGAARLVLRGEAPFAENLREGVEMLSVFAIAVGYVLHVYSALRHVMLSHKSEGTPDSDIGFGSLEQLEDVYRDKIQIMDEVIKQLRQQSLKSIRR